MTKQKKWFLALGIGILAIAVAQSPSYTFSIAGRNVKLSTLEQKNQVFVNITELGKAMGFGVTIDQKKRTVVLSNTSSAVARLTPPVNPNAPIQVNTLTDTPDAKPGDAICADSLGQCSLRAAIQEVVAQKRTRDIRVPNGTYTLERGAFNIPAQNAAFQVRIRGENKDSTIINADGRDRAFVLNAGQKLLLENLTIRNGSTTESGGVIAILGYGSGTNSALTLKSTKFFANKAGGSGAVIAVLQEYGSVSIDISQSEFSGNSASKNGGAISAVIGQEPTSLTIDNSVFIENSSLGSGGAIQTNGNLKITKSQFLKNESSGGDGGAISSRGSTNFSDVTMDGNSASNGGAVFIGRDQKNVSFENTRFLNNTATSNGGALFIDMQSAFNMTKSAFTGNTSKNSGGAIFVSNSNNISIAETNISANQAQTQSGGGIFVASTSQMAVRKSQIFGNTATEMGGGIYIQPQVFQGLSPIVTIDSISLYQNRAKNGAGIYSAGNLTIQNSTVSQNIASNQGGAVFSGESPESPLAPILVLTSSTFYDNQAGDTNANQVYSKQKFTTRSSLFYNSQGKNCNAPEVISLGYNIASDDSCKLTGKADQNNTDPKLGLLADNGGGLLTHLPVVGSPAIDVVPLNTCEARDNRGVVRPQGAACDVGAVERSPTDK